MSADYHQTMTMDFSRRQLFVHRRNLIHVCRLAVKTLVEKSAYETIDDASEEFVNFAAILEHILNHRMKQRTTWYGSSQESKTFWDFVRLACKRLPTNCLGNVEAMEEIKTSRGKGRAWLRMVLMEKRLSDYVVSALQQTKIIKTFYDEGAIMLSEESHILAGILLNLNTIDFSFCLKGENLEMDINPVIDYTPYLKYPNSTPETTSLDGDATGSSELLSSILTEEESRGGGVDGSLDASDASPTPGKSGEHAGSCDAAAASSEAPSDDSGAIVGRNASSSSLGSLEGKEGVPGNNNDVVVNGNGGIGGGGEHGRLESSMSGNESPPPPSIRSMDSISLSTLDPNDNNNAVDGENNNNGGGGEESVKAKYKKLEAKYKTVCEQKGYLEELLRLRESQLEDAQKQRQKLVDSIQSLEAESRRERQQLEGIIIELQAQLSGSPLPTRDVDELCWDALTPAQVFGSEDDLSTPGGGHGFLDGELQLTSTPSSSSKGPHGNNNNLNNNNHLDGSKAERKKLLPENNWLKTLYNEISSSEKQDDEENEKAGYPHQPGRQSLQLQRGGGDDDEDGRFEGGDEEDQEQKKVVPEEAEETFRKLRKANDKAIRYSLHRETLMKYLDKDLVPRGLRINLVPTIGNQVDEFVVKWRDTLHNASKGLMELIVEFCTKEEAKLNVEIMKLQSKLFDMIDDTHQLAETSNLIANLSERARERLTRRKERKLERDEGDMMTVRDNRTGEVIATLKSRNPLDPLPPASTQQRHYSASEFYGEPAAGGFYLPTYPPPYDPSREEALFAAALAAAGAAGGLMASGMMGPHAPLHPAHVDPVIVENSKMNPNAKPFEVPLSGAESTTSTSGAPTPSSLPTSPPTPSSLGGSSTTAPSSSPYVILGHQDFAATPVVAGLYLNQQNYANAEATYGPGAASVPAPNMGYAPVMQSTSNTSNYGPGSGSSNRGGRQYRGAGSGRLHSRGGGHAAGGGNRDNARWEGSGRGGRGGGDHHFRGGGRGGRGGGGGGEHGTPGTRHRSSHHLNGGALQTLPNGYAPHHAKKHGAAT